ncbi:hypothetical protein JAAARDRAFT_50635 [Jaapia argillacea MUCL 33604]|uniref:Uncharacterized protein n=1 Tax=Jaapia argillacea MUCL 33604 TaxID=933084 RepID=A0A067PA98_9AGAM|nr:hypothetical protein JAAARDRAFT_50635 [Jaapia argillacea MUCL 33604]
MRASNIQAWITIDGETLAEYHETHYETGNRKTCECWIPSEAGKSFVIQWKDSHLERVLFVILLVDGVLVDGNTLDGDPLEEDENSDGILELGTIELRFYKTTIDSVLQLVPATSFPKIESVMRGNTASGKVVVLLCFRFGEEEEVDRVDIMEGLSRTKKPFITFKFRYRPRGEISFGVFRVVTCGPNPAAEILQAKGISEVLSINDIDNTVISQGSEQPEKSSSIKRELEDPAIDERLTPMGDAHNEGGPHEVEPPQRSHTMTAIQEGHNTISPPPRRRSISLEYFDGSDFYDGRVGEGPDVDHMAVGPDKPTQVVSGSQPRGTFVSVKLELDMPPSLRPPSPPTHHHMRFHVPEEPKNPNQHKASVVVKPDSDSTPRPSLKRRASSIEEMASNRDEDANLPSIKSFTERLEAAKRGAEEVRKAADEAQQRAHELEIINKQHQNNLAELNQLASRLMKRPKIEIATPSVTVQRKGWVLEGDEEFMDLTGDN